VVGDKVTKRRTKGRGRRKTDGRSVMSGEMSAGELRRMVVKDAIVAAQ
jgi:hypothetical protein